MAESVVIFGWLRDDGTVTFNRDEVIGNVRRVVQGFKNSDVFLKQVEAQWKGGRAWLIAPVPKTGGP
jgi:hypothetical protein